MNTPAKIYFASDFHLGSPNPKASLEREKLIVKWLDTIKKDALEIFLVGDVFDFWFEYKQVIPKGFTRFQGKLAEIADSGIPIHLFNGNHDLWGLEYFEKELGITVYKEPIIRTWNGKNFYIGHGDGLGPGDKTFKIIKKHLFLNPTAQWGFRNLHPDLGIGLANAWSGKSREVGEKKIIFLGNDREWLVQYSMEVQKQRIEKGEQRIDFFVFGHRHLTLDIPLENGARYINLGEWFKTRSYGVFDGEDIKHEYWPGS